VQLLLLASAAACLVGFGDQADIGNILRGLLVTTTVASVAAVLQYLGVLPYQVFLGTDRPIGLYTEPDWLGMFSAVGLIIAFHCTTGWLRSGLVFLHLAVLLLAGARAAWLAILVVGVLGYLIAKLSRRQRVQPSRGNGRLAVVAVLFMVSTLAVSAPLRDSLQTRIEGIFAVRQDVAVEARQQQTAGLLELARQAPWNGLGLSASGRVGVSGRIEYIGQADNNVASNWVLGWWVDGGFLALPLILIFAGAALARLSTTSGLVLSTVLICSFFSNAVLIPIAWVGLALSLLANVDGKNPGQAGMVNARTTRIPTNDGTWSPQQRAEHPQ
jgi:hypothetical protein